MRKPTHIALMTAATAVLAFGLTACTGTSAAACPTPTPSHSAKTSAYIHPAVEVIVPHVEVPVEPHVSTGGGHVTEEEPHTSTGGSHVWLFSHHSTKSCK